MGCQFLVFCGLWSTGAVAAKDLVASHGDPEGGLKSSDRDVCSVGVPSMLC